jgi:hypothetical protein
MIRVEINRRGNATRQLAERLGRLGQKVQAGLEAAGQVLLEESRQLVPVDVGALKFSSHVRTEGTGIASVVYVGYGIRGDVELGYSEKEGRFVIRKPYEYALLVHEGLPEGRNYSSTKYLSRAIEPSLFEMKTAFNTAMK